MKETYKTIWKKAVMNMLNTPKRRQQIMLYQHLDNLTFNNHTEAQSGAVFPQWGQVVIVVEAEVASQKLDGTIKHEAASSLCLSLL
jgi:hypothetical protein